MKAFTIDRYKSKDGGRIVDMPQPGVGDNDVLVQIHAAGVNLLDAKIADGEFKIFLLRRKAKGEATQRNLLVLVHESERHSIERDHITRRPGHHSPSHGQGVSVRRDPGRFGLRRERTCQRQGRRQGEVRMSDLSRVAWAMRY
jgi:hypothetical protein